MAEKAVVLGSDSFSGSHSVDHLLDKRPRQSTRFGIFGTSIAATWLFSELECKAGFFVDEDPDRVGGKHLNLPIYRASEVPAGSDVYVVCPPKISAAIAARLGSATAHYHSVPHFLLAKNPGAL